MRYKSLSTILITFIINYKIHVRRYANINVNVFCFCRDENQHEDHGLFPGRQRGDHDRGREEANEGPAGRRVGAGAVGRRAARAQQGAVVPRPEREGAHGVRDAGDGHGQVDHGDAHAPGAPVGEFGPVADPARQPSVRETGARQRHAADGGRRRGRDAAAHRARGSYPAHREVRPVRAAHGRRHRGRGRRGRVLLRRHRQPVAGAPGFPADPRPGRGPHVPVRPGLAAGPSAARFVVVVRSRRRHRLPGPARRRHTLVPADAVRRVRLRNTSRLDGHALNRINML